MPLYLEDFMNLLAEICDERNMKVAVSEALKGGFITGVSALLGGLLLGPIGLALGGAIGGGGSAISARNKFESVAKILIQLPPTKKQKLYERVCHAFRDLGPTDVVTVMAILGSTQSLRDVAAGVVKNFLSNEMTYTVV